MTILFVGAVFLTIFLSLLALASMRQAAVEEGEAAAPPLTFKEFLRQSNQRLKMILIRKKKPTKKRNALEEELSGAGLTMKPEEFIVFQWIASIIGGGLLHLVLQNMLMMTAGAIIGFLIPKILLKSKRRKRIKQFNAGLPGMITSIIGSLRAGFSFPQSLQMISEESYSPIKEEVQLVLKSMQYGTSLEEALLEWKKRLPSEDLSLLVEAILIQRQVGGNLAYLLDKIVETTRERAKIENQIKTLTAQGRLSGMIISLLPIGLGGIIYVMNPEYILTLFTNPIGQAMLAAALIGGVIGFILIRKITTIEV
ncbi:secretion system protein [Halobacillus andaensis]|uniref:Secretion system protein n=1 Tax=Halobacillus andaensis TaxID=1176239 RepID=A0A917B923_HALAA|nr:type II secretion system F family protein [Halobacillus andaensis]MBP2005083.1 tight adherence protein B [Halobacillus andaensis]GGF28741.1 secretion system protein [Halobacillus andaensis]